MAKCLFGAVFNRKGKLSKDGKGDISVRAYDVASGQRVHISVGIKVAPECWDKRRQRVKPNTPNALEINKRITELLEKLERYTIEQETKGRGVSLEQIKELAAPSNKPEEFIKFFEGYIRNSRTMKENTKKSYKSVLKHLRAFRKRIEFDELTYRLIDDFALYLSKRVGTNTAAKYLKQIRAVVYQGIRVGVVPENINPFRGYRIKTEESKPKYILPKEVEKLEGLNLSGKREALAYVRDMYLFSVYTGLRISDTTIITPRNIQRSEGGTFLALERMQKTGRAVRLPLHTLFNGKPLELLKRYELDEDIPYFGRYSHPHVNKVLKELAELAGIKKKLTFHTARHTNGTMLLNKGVNIAVVQKVLGHTKQSTTEIYAKLLETTIQDELRKAFDR